VLTTTLLTLWIIGGARSSLSYTAVFVRLVTAQRIVRLLDFPHEKRFAMLANWARERETDRQYLGSWHPSVRNSTGSAATNPPAMLS
jgi:hypothetical protein